MAATASVLLRIREVSKSYGSRGRSAREPQLVLDRLSLEADAGEFVTVIGPSGCGKSTLLACVGGLVGFDSGEIFVAGQKVDGPLPECAVVFQQPSLLPWRSVARNVEYGLELDRVPRADRARVAAHALRLVGLADYSSYLPHELSGGMQQRVNLARALAMEPELLLMDEPFGALDALTKERLQDELVRLTGSGGRTTLFVTHDVEEAVFLGDRVVVMQANPGRIVDVFKVPLERPRSREDLSSSAIVQLIAGLRALLAPAAAGSGATTVT